MSTLRLEVGHSPELAASGKGKGIVKAVEAKTREVRRKLADILSRLAFAVGKNEGELKERILKEWSLSLTKACDFICSLTLVFNLPLRIVTPGSRFASSC
jgi:hypothetical protein